MALVSGQGYEPRICYCENAKKRSAVRVDEKQELKLLLCKKGVSGRGVSG